MEFCFQFNLRTLENTLDKSSVCILTRSLAHLLSELKLASVSIALCHIQDKDTV